MRLVWGTFVLALILLVCAPTGMILIGGFGSDAITASRDIFSSTRVVQLIVNSLIVSLGTGAVAVMSGGALAISSIYWPKRSRPILSALVTIPLLIPPYVFATAWVDLLGTSGIFAQIMNTTAGQRWATPDPYNVFGVVLVLGLAYAPIAFWCTRFGLLTSDGRKAEPLRMAGGEFAVVCHVVLRQVSRHALIGGLLVMLLALLDMSVPALLQVNVYPVEIYTEFNLTYDMAAATVRAIPLVLLGIAAYAIYRGVSRNGRAFQAEARPTWTPAHVSFAHSTFSILVAAPVVVLATLLPFAVIVVRSLPMKSYGEAFVTGGEEFALSIVIGVVTAIVVCGVAVLAQHVLSRRVATICTAIALVTFLVSGPVNGIGLISLWNRPGIAGLVYDSPVIIVLACAARTLGPAMVIARILFDAQPARYAEVSDVFGVSPWNHFRYVALPSALPGIAAIALFVFAWSFGELGATVLVCPPGYTMLSVRLHTLLHYGPSSLTSAMSVLSAVVPIAAGMLFMAIARRGVAANA